MFSYLKQGPGFYRQVVLLATPIILQNLITSTLGMADTFMVGLLGELPMAAVALANIPLFVVQLFVFGLQSGSTVLLSQYWGQQDKQAINRVMGVTFWIAGTVSLVFALILFFLPEQFLSLFGKDPAIVALAARYGRIAGFSYFLNSFTMVYIAAFRAMENPQLGMYILMASMSCNTFLNWVLIFGKLGAPALGVEGAALATLIARGLEVGIMALHIGLNRGFRLHFRLLFRPGLEMTARFIRYGGPVVCNETLWGLGTSVFPTIMGHMDGSQEILAAFTLAGNVEKICAVVGFGLAATASILVGREIGAGRSHSVYQVGLALDTLAVLCGVVQGALLLLFAYVIAPVWVFPLFQLSPQASRIASMMIGIYALLSPMKDFNNTNIVGVLRGGGDVQASTLIDLSPLWLAAIPAAFLTGLVFRMGILWVFLSICLEQVVKAAAGVWRLRTGRWIHDLTRPTPIR
ncbi:MAG: MATE family efflux transporter [Lawsonibacter sp.]|nr:MATE family efflux transporter [Lawsonibacter sp.]